MFIYYHILFNFAITLCSWSRDDALTLDLDFAVIIPDGVHCQRDGYIDKI